MLWLRLERTDFLSDAIITQDLKYTVRDFRRVESRSNMVDLNGNTKSMINRFDKREGLGGKIFTDTLLKLRLDSSLLRFRKRSKIGNDGNIESIVKNLK